MRPERIGTRAKAITIAAFLAVAADALDHGDGASPPFGIAWKKECAIAGAGLLCAAAGVIAEHSIQPLTPGDVERLSKNSLNPLDRSATCRYSPSAETVSDALVALIAVAPAVLLADKAIVPSWRRPVSLMYLEVALLSYALPALGKGIAARNRPFTYNPDVPLEEKLTGDARASFFSRHTTFAFASACFMSSVYGAHHPNSAIGPYLRTGGLLAAAATGATRYACGAHFPTDIITGALAGCAIGCGVPWLHAPAGRRSATLSLRPVNGGFVLSYGM